MGVKRYARRRSNIHYLLSYPDLHYVCISSTYWDRLGSFDTAITPVRAQEGERGTHRWRLHIILAVTIPFDGVGCIHGQTRSRDGSTPSHTHTHTHTTLIRSQRSGAPKARAGGGGKVPLLIKHPHQGNVTGGCVMLLAFPFRTVWDLEAVSTPPKVPRGVFAEAAVLKVVWGVSQLHVPPLLTPTESSSR